MREMYEWLMIKYNVDLIFFGHVHAYERVKPVNNYKVSRGKWNIAIAMILDLGSVLELHAHMVANTPQLSIVHYAACKIAGWCANSTLYGTLSHLMCNKILKACTTLCPRIAAELIATGTHVFNSRVLYIAACAPWASIPGNNWNQSSNQVHVMLATTH